MAKLFIYGFALVGMIACSSAGGGSSTSNNGNNLVISNPSSVDVARKYHRGTHPRRNRR